MTTAVELERLTIRYGSHCVIQDLSLCVAEGQITALVGPSGCGKSTLLSSMNRMTDLIHGCKVDGEIRIHGQNIFDSRMDPIELRRTVGLVFQQPTPFPISIRKNLSIPLKELGLSNTEVAKRTGASLVAAGLWDEVKDRLDAVATQLSGGQQQRLCIARALSLSPKVLLLDEPCSALDEAATDRIEQTLVNLKDSVTIIIATHNLDQASRIASETIDLGQR